MRSISLALSGLALRRRARRRDNNPLSASEIKRVDKAAHVAFRREQTA